jgi:hypothetical protein
MKSGPVGLNLTWYVVLQFLKSASEARVPACDNMFSAYMVTVFLVEIWLLISFRHGNFCTVSPKTNCRK